MLTFHHECNLEKENRVKGGYEEEGKENKDQKAIVLLFFLLLCSRRPLDFTSNTLRDSGNEGEATSL
jgi:hypothetical protein